MSNDTDYILTTSGDTTDTITITSASCQGYVPTTYDTDGKLRVSIGSGVECDRTRSTCSACKKEDVEIWRTYNPTEEDASLERSICKGCYCKAMDKIFGVDMDAELEETLYADESDQT